MSSRKASMTMADLTAIHENRIAVAFEEASNVDSHHHRYHDRHQPNEDDDNVMSSEQFEIFEELCEVVEIDDLATQSLNRHARRYRCSSDDLDVSSSTTKATTTATATTKAAFKIQYQRRHSSYEPSNRHLHRQEHRDFKEYFQTLQDKHFVRRASFVNNLLEFNLSMGVASYAAAAAHANININHDSSLAVTAAAALAHHKMHLSCPVLSYMYDEEEDSIELVHMKHPSMTYVGEDSLESWESLKDDGETELPLDGHEQSREYIIQLPPLMDEDGSLEHDHHFLRHNSSGMATAGGDSQMQRRRKSHSYKLLEQELAESSPRRVLRSMSIKHITNALASSEPSSTVHAAAATTTNTASAMHAKELDDEPMDYPRPAYQQEAIVSARPATARGA